MCCDARQDDGELALWIHVVHFGRDRSGCTSSRHGRPLGRSHRTATTSGPAQCRGRLVRRRCSTGRCGHRRGNATIENQRATVFTNDNPNLSATADQATLSTARSATIVNKNNDITQFEDDGNCGQAIIMTFDASFTKFIDQSTAGNFTLIVERGGRLVIQDGSTGGLAFLRPDFGL